MNSVPIGSLATCRGAHLSDRSEDRSAIGTLPSHDADSYATFFDHHPVSSVCDSLRDVELMSLRSCCIDGLNPQPNSDAAPLATATAVFRRSPVIRFCSRIDKSSVTALCRRGRPLLWRLRRSRVFLCAV